MRPDDASHGRYAVPADAEERQNVAAYQGDHLHSQDCRDDMIEAFDSGADAYLTKPISLKYLRTRIDRMVTKRQCRNHVVHIQGKKTYNKEEQIFLFEMQEIIDDNLKNKTSISICLPTVLP